jgi:hypothetical protein
MARRHTGLRTAIGLAALCLTPLRDAFSLEAKQACARMSAAQEYISCPENLAARVLEKAYPSPARIERTAKSLHIYGFISTTTVVAAEEALQNAPPFFPVYIDSPGGSPGAAMQIGRILREKEARTILNDDSVCISACNFLFMSGRIRKASAKAVFGSHSFDLRCMKREHQNKIAQMAEQEVRFAFDMGISKCFLPEIMFRYRQDQIYCVSPEQMDRYNLDNITQISKGGVMPECNAETERLMAEIKQIGRAVEAEAQ